MLVVVTAPWCTYCRKMFRETFVDGNVAALVNDRFLPVVVDTDVNRRLGESLGVQSLPTTLVISPDRTILSTVSGFQSASQLQATLGRYAAAPVVAAATRRPPAPWVDGGINGRPAREMKRYARAETTTRNFVTQDMPRQSFVDKYVRGANSASSAARTPQFVRYGAERPSFVDKYVRNSASPPVDLKHHVVERRSFVDKYVWH